MGFFSDISHCISWLSGFIFSGDCIAGIWLGVKCRHTGSYSSSIALFSFKGGTKQTVFICKFSLT
jgi:hypothetical protein